MHEGCAFAVSVPAASQSPASNVAHPAVMTSTSQGSDQRRQVERHPRRDRVALMMAAVATAVGMWLGLTAPSMSPVAPPPLPVDAVVVVVPFSAPS